jgi:serine/threonine protein kinase
MEKCRCYKKDGKPCPYKHLPGSRFCGIHKNCTHIQDPIAIVVAPNPPPPKPPKAPKLVTLRTIAKGGFGETFLVQDTNTKKKYVMKKSLRHKTSQIIQQYSNLELVHALKHPNFIAPHYISPAHDFFLMEYLEGYETLLDVISTRRPVSSAMLRRWAQTLVLSVDLLHKHDIAHRDIKPKNIMVNTTTGDLRIIDFGLACTKMTCSSVSWAGTQIYMPPFMMTTYKQFSFDLQTRYDWWATGLTLLYLASPNYTNPILDRYNTVKKLTNYYNTKRFKNSEIPRLNQILNHLLILPKQYTFFL